MLDVVDKVFSLLDITSSEQRIKTPDRYLRKLGKKVNDYIQEGIKECLDEIYPEYISFTQKCIKENTAKIEAQRIQQAGLPGAHLLSSFLQRQVFLLIYCVL